MVRKQRTLGVGMVTRAGRMKLGDRLAKSWGSGAVKTDQRERREKGQRE